MLYSRARNERNSNNSSNANNDASGGTSSGRTGSASNCNATGGSAAPGSSSSSLTPSDRDAFGRWRDRQYFGPRKWFHPLRDESSWDKDGELVSRQANDFV